MNDSFVFYRSFWEGIKRLPDSEKLKAINAILYYAFDGIEPEEDGLFRIAFEMAKPQIDANAKRKSGGKLGGAPAGNQNAKKQQEQPKVELENNHRLNKKQPNVNVNDNVNVNNNIYSVGQAPTQPTLTEKVKAIIGYLNEKAGTKFKSESKDTRNHIKARLNENYTLEDFYKVIDNKVADWKSDAKMQDYLRPRTLFGTNFEAYLNQRPKSKTPKNSAFHNFEQRDIDVDSLEAQLDKLHFGGGE